MSGAGIAVGLGGAYTVSRALATLLYGIEPHDPRTFAAVAAMLAAVSLARRASRVDPMVALKDE